MSITPHTGPTGAQVAAAEESSRRIEDATRHLRAADRPARVPPPGINIERTRDGWKIVSATELTNEQANAIAFRADPADVVMGDHVAVHDPAGMRIGRLSGATHHERAFGSAYASCSITLR